MSRANEWLLSALHLSLSYDTLVARVIRESRNVKLRGVFQEGFQANAMALANVTQSELVIR